MVDESQNTDSVNVSTEHSGGVATESLDSQEQGLAELRDVLHRRLFDQDGYSSVRLDRGYLTLTFNLRAFEIRLRQARPTTPLLQKIVEIADVESAQEVGDAEERLKAIHAFIIGEAV